MQRISYLMLLFNHDQKR